MTGLDSTVLGVGLALLAALSLAANSLSVMLGTRYGRSSDALVVVLLVNVTVFVPLALVVAYPTYALSSTAIWSFVAAGLVGTLFARILYYVSIERIGASRSEPVKASQPLHASLIAVLVLGETLSGPHALGIMLIVAGVVFITVETSMTSFGLEHVSPLALVLPFSAAFLFGLEPIFAKIGFNAGTPALVGLAIKTLSATVGFVVYLWWRDALSFTTTRRSSLFWYLVAGGANTSFLLSYYTALALSPVTVVVPILQTSPVFVVGLSFLFLRGFERVTWQLVLGTGIVVAGSVVVTLFG